MKDSLRLRREPAEKEKEILFLKKAAAFFAKEIVRRLPECLFCKRLSVKELTYSISF